MTTGLEIEEGLFWFQRFKNLSLTYLFRDLTYFQSRYPHGACNAQNKMTYQEANSKSIGQSAATKLQPNPRD